jgi:hypothetical protein
VTKAKDQKVDGIEDEECPECGWMTLIFEQRYTLAQIA